MNYDICKKLRDAGFKQYGDGKHEIFKYYEGTRYYPGGIVNEIPEFKLYIPVLSDLVTEIEKLTQHDWGLASDQFDNKGFIAWNGSPEGLWSKSENGKTPEEAMAKLYLSLNQNK